MVVKRKKTVLDGTDKEILRNLLTMDEGLSGRQIAKRVGLKDSSIRPRLDNLKKKGYVKDICSAFRDYDRKFKLKNKKRPVRRRVISCSKRTWKLNIDK